jgi:Zn-dependent protease
MKLEIKPSAAVFVVLMTVFFQAWLGWLQGFVAAVLLSLCVLAHEAGHTLAAYRYNVKVKKIGIAVEGGYTVRERSNSLVAEAAITTSGIAVNVFLFAILLRFHHPVTTWVAFGNLAVVLVNLLPIGPSDGRRLLGLLAKAFQSLAS